MKVYNTLGALFALALFSHTTVADESKRAVNMACAMFPPYKIESRTSDVPHSGIDLDVVRAAFAEAGREVNFSFFPWKRTVKMAERGETDALCGCAYRPEREEKLIYSDMLGLHSQGVFISDESLLKTVDSLSDLNGRSIAAVRGYAVHSELKAYPDIRVVEANDDDQLLRLLSANRVDAIYSYRDIILYRMAMSSNSRKIRYFEFSSQPYYLCFSRKPSDIQSVVDDFNWGLRVIRFNGRYQDIWGSYR